MILIAQIIERQILIDRMHNLNWVFLFKGPGFLAGRCSTFLNFLKLAHRYLKFFQLIKLDISFLTNYRIIDIYVNAWNTEQSLIVLCLLQVHFTRFGASEKKARWSALEDKCLTNYTKELMNKWSVSDQCASISYILNPETHCSDNTTEIKSKWI